MSPDIKKKWIEALRSGKYKQGRGQLRLGDSFCCLGVLCDVIDPNGWNGDRYRTCLMGLSDKMKNDLGLTYEQIASLVWFNDHERLDFDMIAQYVEDKV